MLENHSAQLEVIGTTLQEQAAQMLLLLTKFVKNTTTRHDSELDEHDRQIGSLSTRVDHLGTDLPK